MATKQTKQAQDMQAMFEQFAAFMQAQNVQDNPAPVKVRNGRSGKQAAKSTTKSSVPRKQTANTTATRTTKPTRSTPRGVITCGEAWKLLGADPTYTPSNPSAPARNAQLWALNAKGLLRVAQ